MLKHKVNSALAGAEKITTEVINLFKVLTKDISHEEKAKALNDIRDRCSDIIVEYGYLVLAKEVVAVGFSAAAQNGGILYFLGLAGSAILNSFLFAVIAMFLKGVIVAGIVVALFSKAAQQVMFA